MKTNATKMIIGLLLVVLGSLWLLSALIPGFDLNWGLLWPIFLLIPGVILWGVWIGSPDKQKSGGLVIPASILTLLAGLFFINMVSSLVWNYDDFWALSSFLYTGIVAVALWAGAEAMKKPGLRKAAQVLGTISLVIFSATLFGYAMAGLSQVAYIVGPVLLIAIGILVAFGPLVKKK
ncbi:MAG: hypothetical protein ABIG66_02945 [Candidatus Kerfeldbacteria bacterium]